jgi:mRNA-degrading endonuclease toxin of MazEF toxin-antitoxin module
VPPRRGEVWLFDCGMVAKVRPVLILSIPFAASDRAVVTAVFHTTALRGSDFEVKIQVPFLERGRVRCAKHRQLSDRSRDPQTRHAQFDSVVGGRSHRVQMAWSICLSIGFANETLSLPLARRIAADTSATTVASIHAS